MTVFFLHIPKTAGTSVSHALRTTIDWDSHLFVRDPAHALRIIDLPSDTPRQHYQLVHGHYHFGLVDAFFRGEDYPRLVMTVLREPIARVLSAYGFVSSQFGAELGAIGRAAWGLADHLQSTENDNWFFADNLSVRFLVRKWRDKGDACTRADLDEAKAVLENDMQLVGFVEGLDYVEESLSALYDVDLRERVYNRSMRSLRPDDVPPADLKLIREENSLDIELYDWARARREQFKAAGLANVARYKATLKRPPFALRPGDDGDYLTAQNLFDQTVAQVNARYQDVETREQLITSLRAFGAQAEAQLQASLSRMDALGGEITGLLRVNGDIERRLVDTNSVLAGRAAFVAELKARGDRLSRMMPQRARAKMLASLGIAQDEVPTRESELATVEALAGHRDAAAREAQGLSERLDALGGEGAMLKAEAEQLLAQVSERTALAEDRVEKYSKLRALLAELR